MPVQTPDRLPALSFPEFFTKNANRSVISSILFAYRHAAAVAGAGFDANQTPGRRSLGFLQSRR